MNSQTTNNFKHEHIYALRKPAINNQALYL